MLRNPARYGVAAETAEVRVLRRPVGSATAIADAPLGPDWAPIPGEPGRFWTATASWSWPREWETVDSPEWETITAVGGTVVARDADGEVVGVCRMIDVPRGDWDARQRRLGSLMDFLGRSTNPARLLDPLVGENPSYWTVNRRDFDERALTRDEYMWKYDITDPVPPHRRDLTPWEEWKCPRCSAVSAYYECQCGETYDRF